jgi:threonyl-tRNA synthetase
MSSSNLDQKRHSAAHLLAMAVLEKYPDAKLGIGPTIENGFYYDFELPSSFSADDLILFEKQMKKLVQGKLGFDRSELSTDEATKRFEDQPFKVELIKDLAKEGNKSVSLYKTGEFTDLCRGGHVESTTEINPDGLKLMKTAGAYWRGDESRPMLQRIYGVLFDTKEELDAYLTQLDEAEKRDHKKLGKELDLFTFSDLVGPGLPLWTPKGTIIRNLLDDFVWQLRRAKGYQKVTIPHITKRDLYEKSGHWAKFADELFRIKTREGHEFAMKPMNCPHHAQIYASRQRSYRSLPERYTETTMVYRDEQTGELGGLSRVRSITQDDAHVFCRKSQIRDEANAIWDIVDTFYSRFGFDLTVRFSRHDPDQFDKYLGTREIWREAEAELKAIIDSHNVEAVDGLGEAALYGPKIDFMGKDALGRLHQVATIQLDFNQPERFDLYCINEAGEQERIVMIHAAIMGSIERFMSILIEHYAGAFPTWLAPVQVSIIPVSDKFNHYATEHAYEPLLKAGIRVELNEDNESVGKKIRYATTQKIPYSVVIGEKEIESAKLAIRSRDDGELEPVTIEELIQRLQSESV